MPWTWVSLAAVLLASTSAGAQDDLAHASPATPLAVAETFTIESKALGETRHINVWWPPEYADSATVRLPVLYMPDGGVGEDFLHVMGLLEVSIGNGTMRPFMLVGIENTKRRRDMTGPTENPEDRKIAPQVGGSAAFRSFFRSELIPLVNARYRTTGETAIIGESLAGLFIVETLFTDPGLFDTYIAFDPSVWWNHEALLKGAGPRMPAGSARPKAVYLASSGDGLPELTRRLAERLQQDRPAGLTVRYEAMPAETHATIYHPAALAAVRQLFKPAAAPH